MLSGRRVFDLPLFHSPPLNCPLRPFPSLPTHLAAAAAVSQVITAAEFHPNHCNVLAYSSSKGCIRLADMRSAALCDRHAKSFEEVESQVSRPMGIGAAGRACGLREGGYARGGRVAVMRGRRWEMGRGVVVGQRCGAREVKGSSSNDLPSRPLSSRPQANKSFFSEIIASISDISFSKDGRFILSRDYMTLKLWDINKESAPVATYNVHEHLRAKVGEEGC